MGLFLFLYRLYYGDRGVSEKIKNKESLLVGFFLAGLVTLGSVQQWWLQEVLTKMRSLALFYGSALTAITDNAALTYPWSLVELSDSSKYFLVAGAVAGGG